MSCSTICYSPYNVWSDCPWVHCMKHMSCCCVSVSVSVSTPWRELEHRTVPNVGDDCNRRRDSAPHELLRRWQGWRVPGVCLSVWVCVFSIISFFTLRTSRSPDFNWISIPGTSLLSRYNVHSDLARGLGTQYLCSRVFVWWILDQWYECCCCS